MGAVLVGRADDLQLAVGEDEPGPAAAEAGRGGLLLALAPWAAYTGAWGHPPPASEFDRLWLGFRDRFGLVWGQRLREQFNRSAVHAGWPVTLRWTGLRLRPGTSLPRPEVQEEILATLRALLKRFGPEENESRGAVA